MNNQFQFEDPEEEIHLSDYWRIIRRHKWKVVTVFLVIVTAVTVKTVLTTPIYRASATLFVDQESSNVVTVSENSVGLGGGGYANYKEYFQSQKAIITSRSLLEPIFRDFRLGADPRFDTVVQPADQFSWADQLRELIVTLTGVSLETGPKYPVHSDPVDKFRQSVSVEEVSGTRLLRLSVENKDPVLAAEIANRIAQDFVERNLAYISKSEILDLHKNEYIKLKAQLDELSKVYKHKHPKILRAQEKLEQITRRIKQERDENLPGQQPVISASDLAGLKANNISVQDWAQASFVPVRPNKRKNVMLAVVIGLMAGAGLAFLLEYLDNTVKGYEDVERQVEWPFLGYVPMVRHERQLDFLMQDKPKSAVSEAYRTIRTGLLFSATEEYPLQTILLTSPGQKEGKSTTVCNLAIAMAQNNKKVLLVDADMRKPRLHHDFDTDNRVGISSYLSGQETFDKCVRSTRVENLSFMACGPYPPNPSELLASGRMKDFMDQARRQFDYIFFDTPPVMMVTDAVILSRFVDGTVLIMESGRTSRKVVPRLKQILKNAKTRVVGLVINKIKAQSGEYSYQYNYYSRYYGQEEEAKTS
ncbi:MAG: polysaccharide biosynthesis tyrosine autokinase [Candidatus Omnitrophica bacterium]|nr:polysaccharide biosynthesis tyrosine autokinase [Candidatus Omnitrophota bacterium]